MMKALDFIFWWLLSSISTMLVWAITIILLHLLLALIFWDINPTLKMLNDVLNGSYNTILRFLSILSLIIGSLLANKIND